MLFAPDALCRGVPFIAIRLRIAAIKLRQDRVINILSKRALTAKRYIGFHRSSVGREDFRDIPKSLL